MHEIKVYGPDNCPKCDRFIKIANKMIGDRKEFTIDKRKLTDVIVELASNSGMYGAPVIYISKVGSSVRPNPLSDSMAIQELKRILDEQSK